MMFNPLIIRNLQSLQLSLLAGSLSTLLLYAIPQFALASEHASKQWEAVTLDMDLSERVKLNLDAQHRGNGGFGHTNSVLLRPAMGYQLTKNLSIWQGYGWTPGFYPYENQHRLFEQLVYNRKIKKLSMSNRVRLEQRYMPALFSGASVRIIGRVKLEHPLPKYPEWYILVYNETYYNLNTKHNGPQRGFDQNRAFAGVGHQLNESAALEMGYIMQYVNRPGNPDTINHIMQVGLKIKP